jgi:hypothetical protein
MIYEALTCVCEEINEYFKNKLKVNDDKVILSGIVDQHGSIAIQGENKIILTLINVEKETIVNGNGSSAGMSFTAGSNQPVNINLYVLFSAYFSSNNYPESLRFLSFIIGYFQFRTVFNRANTPQLDARIDKLIFEMAKFSHHELSNLWSAIGAKYLPSVIYKVRMLSIDESVMKEYRPTITGIDSGDN